MQAHIRGAQTNEKIKARYGGLTDSAGEWTGEVRLMVDDLGKPGSVRKPTTWAIWNDLFHPDVPFEFIRRAFAVMWFHERHTFLILTKRPRRMAEFFIYWQREMQEDYGRNVLETWPLPNVWLGVTVEHPDYLHRIDELFKSPAALYYVSVEPMLESVDLGSLTWITTNKEKRDGYFIAPFSGTRFPQPMGNVESGGKPPQDGPGLDWVICGAETGHHKRPMELDWARDLRDQCRAAGVPFFFKEDSSGSRLLDGRTWDEMPLKLA